MIYQVVLGSIVFFLLAYRFYGRFLAGRFQADDLSSTPACLIDDGIDYVPAKAPLLLGNAGLQAFEIARAMGMGNEDHTAIAKVWEKLLGVEVRANI